jgi:hypothetical protein
LKEKGIQWHGLYAGRRATATLLTQLTGNVIGAQSVLRHKSPNTTEEFYAKLLKESGSQAMQLVERVVTNMLDTEQNEPKALAGLSSRLN